MKHFVLDSFALLVFFEQQKDWEKVEHYLVQASNDKVELSMSLINYGEIFYITAQREGSEEAERIIKIVDGLPIHIVNPDKVQTIQAATYKAEGGISYADCFAAALTEKLNATLVTGDPEFKKLKKKISIEWIEK
jgi:uncharacterized protein